LPRNGKGSAACARVRGAPSVPSRKVALEAAAGQPSLPSGYRKGDEAEIAATPSLILR